MESWQPPACSEAVMGALSLFSMAALSVPCFPPLPRTGVKTCEPGNPQCCPSVGLCSGQVAPVLALRVRQVFYKDGKGT